MGNCFVLDCIREWKQLGLREISFLTYSIKYNNMLKSAKRRNILLEHTALRKGELKK